MHGRNLSDDGNALPLTWNHFEAFRFVMADEARWKLSSSEQALLRARMDVLRVRSCITRPGVALRHIRALRGGCVFPSAL